MNINYHLRFYNLSLFSFFLFSQYFIGWFPKPIKHEQLLLLPQTTKQILAVTEQFIPTQPKCRFFFFLFERILIVRWVEPHYIEFFGFRNSYLHIGNETLVCLKKKSTPFYIRNSRFIFNTFRMLEKNVTLYPMKPYTLQKHTNYSDQTTRRLFRTKLQYRSSQVSIHTFIFLKQWRERLYTRS